MRRRLIDVGLALGYAGLIFLLSSQSTFPVPKGIWSFDKGIHCIEYGVLAFLLSRAIVPLRPWVAVILSSLYGVSDEVHQYFVPGRSSEGLDVLADVVGSVLGAVVFTFHSRVGSRVKRGT